MAEQLYLQVLAVQAEGPAHHQDGALQQVQSVFATMCEDDLDAALDVLLTAAWDGPLDTVRSSREELASRLHIDIKTRKVARVAHGRGTGGQGENVGVDTLPTAEQESYQSLLDDAARGGGY